MKKYEIIDRIMEIKPNRYSRKELSKIRKSELEDILDDLTGGSSLFPNGRDYDSADEDFV